MSMYDFFLAVMIAACYALWGMLGKYYQLPGDWAMTAVLLGSLVGCVGPALPVLRATQMPALFPLAMMFVAGILNGAAMSKHGAQMVQLGPYATSFVVVIIVAMVAWTPTYDRIFNHAVFDGRTFLGLLLAIAAVYVLAGR